MNTATKPIADITPADYNPRVQLQPGDPEFEQLKRSIETHGFATPLVWNATTKTLIAGHQRLAVLKHLGHTEATVVEVELGPTEERALNVALNRIEGRWDDKQLLILLDELVAGGVDAELVGFTADDYDDVLRRIDQASATSFLDDLLDGPEHDEPDDNLLDEVPEALKQRWHLLSYRFPEDERDTIFAAIAKAKADEEAATSADAALAIAERLMADQGEPDATETA